VTLVPHVEFTPFPSVLQPHPFQNFDTFYRRLYYQHFSTFSGLGAC